MSILRKPYEITIWNDVWDTATLSFKEQRIGIIGSNSMDSQCRALEPQLTENINGVKKFTFKLYKKYLDIVSGEMVENPFVGWLTNEQKVKLYYNNQWYDFIVKNISEESEKYLCTYQCEDALVQELSKNGFGVVLDNSLQNNSGTASELAEYVLSDTDWSIDTSSEPFTQTIEENLVYVKLSKDFTAQQILESSIGLSGNTSSITLTSGTQILAFYSSCTGKPYRFQFIYLNGATPQITEERIITNANCQYYIDIGAADQYSWENAQYGFSLPAGMQTITVKEDDTDNIIISTKYKGRRYGFTQKSRYVESLKRYVNEYSCNGVSYYGYSLSEYTSNTIAENFISNSTFKSTSGWTGTRTDNSSGSPGAKIENVYGYFEGGRFHDSLTEYANEGMLPVNKNYKNYLKIEITDASSDVLINSCIYDRKSTVGSIEQGERWGMEYVCHTSNGTECTSLTCQLGDYSYHYGIYIRDNSLIEFSTFDNNLCTVVKCDYTAESFQKYGKTRLCIKFPAAGTYYLSGALLYRESQCSEGSVKPPMSKEDIEETIIRGIETKYYYFLPSQLDDIVNENQLANAIVETTLSYTNFKPVFDNRAEKIRSIQAKESNYFNILQTIAETFEGWITFNIIRDPNTGAIESKKILFKNYIDRLNPVSIKYGINLKKIQRTFESKQIVSKLIVKQNSNEFAKNGFCTIARAAANPSGENYIYDFQYFYNTGLMSARDFLEHTYVINDLALGPDLERGQTSNAQGYFPRVKTLNDKIEELDTILISISKDLVKASADLEVASAGKQSAESGKEDASFRFKKMTGEPIESASSKLSTADLISKRSDIKNVVSEYLVFESEAQSYARQEEALKQRVNEAQLTYNEKDALRKTYTNYKKALNKAFFTYYSRFILEGTWIDEEYVDDELYYADSLSVMYNSCYPKVAYTVDIVDIAALPEYSNYTYLLGDSVKVEDEQFFGTTTPITVIITEKTEDLDDPTKSKIKVQNFKNQFQDLFQKITAAVQSAEYSTGSYEKAVALAEAKEERKMQFLSDALSSANARLAVAGQQTVTQGADGITITDQDSPCDQVRIIGGAILLSKQDENGQQKWTTAVSADGVSASLITAGIINTSEISIMNYDEPVFRWDAYGLTALSAEWYEGVISNVDRCKFVRFDKYGIYGVNNSGVSADTWHPNNLEELDNYSTFSLTWDGLKVAKEEGGCLRIGKIPNGETERILQVTKSIKNSDTGETDEVVTLAIEQDGTVTWGEGNNISFDRADIIDWMSLTDQDGIYPLGNGNIGINATAIKAGAICVGDAPTVNNKGEITDWNENVFYADINGDVVRLAGWEVTNNMISRGTLGKKDSFLMATGDMTGKIGNKNRSDWRLGVGSKFGVTADGIVYATEGQFTGSIIGGTIGIGGTPDKPNFQVDSDGNVITAGTVTLGGDIKMSGNILWGTGTSPTQVLYSESGGQKPKYLYDNPLNQSELGWYKEMEPSHKYASYTYDGGATWSPAVKIVGTDGSDGRDGQDGQDGSDATVTRDAVVEAFMNTNTADGIYSHNIGSEAEPNYVICIDASAIKTGKLNADLIGTEAITADKINGKGLSIKNGSFSGIVEASSFSARVENSAHEGGTCMTLNGNGILFETGPSFVGGVQYELAHFYEDEIELGSYGSNTLKITNNHLKWKDGLLFWQVFFEWNGEPIGKKGLPPGVLTNFENRIKTLENSGGGGGGGGVSQTDFEDLVRRVNNLESQHSVSVNVVSEASCTEPEYSALVCESCGEIGERYETGEPTEHKFDSKVISADTIYASATCSRGPLYYYSCSNCDEVSTDPSQIFEDTNGNRLPHTIVNGIKPGTGRVNNGKHQHQSGAYCANCDHEEYLTYVDAAQNEFSNGVCNSCQWSCNNYGHNWSNWEKISNIKWVRQCQICGKVERTTNPPIQI